MWKLIACSLLLVGVVLGQILFPILSQSPSVVGGTGTFTIRQGPIFTNCSVSGATCSMNPTGPLTTQAGNLIVLIDSSNVIGALPVSITGANSNVLNLTLALSCNNFQNSCAYVLPSANNQSLTWPITYTRSAAATSEVKLWELVPSANGTNVGYDNSGTITTSTSNPLGPAFTLSGTNDAVFHFLNSTSSTPTAISAPYATAITGLNPDLNQFVSWAVGLPANGNAPTWTDATNEAVWSHAAAFGWNVTACVDRTFVDFEGGTSGNTVVPSTLDAHTFGWRPGANPASTTGWGLTGTITWSSSVASTLGNFPLQGSTGRMCGDGVNRLAGQGTLGVVETSTGSLANNHVSYGWQWGETALSASIWFCSDADATDGSAIDAFIIQSDGPENIGFNFNGTGAARFLQLEGTQGLSPGPNYACSTGCPSPGGANSCATTSNWVNLRLKYVTSGSHTAAVYKTDGTQLGSTMSVTSAGNHPNSVTVGHIGNQNLPNGKHMWWDSLIIYADAPAVTSLTQ